MTDYNKKVRAVILAALMVFSVFAGTVALSGSAAAAAGTPVLQNESLSPTSVAQTTVTHDVSFDVDNYSATGDSTTEISISAGSFADADLEVTDVDNTTTLSGKAVSTASGSSIDITTNGKQNVSISGTVTIDWSGTTSGDKTVNINAYDGSATATGTVDANTPVTVTVSSSTTRSNPGAGDADSQVYNGSTVFQGEEDITFVDSSGNQLDSLTGTSGDAEGQTLTIPIDDDQATGQYDENGPDQFQDSVYGVTVLQPQIEDLEILNTNGEDIAGGSVREGEGGASGPNTGTGSGDLDVVADYNYEESENIELTVEDDTGLDVTGDALTQNGGPAVKGANTDGEDVTWNLDLTDLGTGTYTVTVAGSDDLDFGSATESTTITVTGDDDITNDLDMETATRGVRT